MKEEEVVVSVAVERGVGHGGGGGRGLYLKSYTRERRWIKGAQAAKTQQDHPAVASCWQLSASFIALSISFLAVYLLHFQFHFCDFIFAWGLEEFLKRDRPSFSNLVH